MLDLVDGGSTAEEVIQLGKAVETAGATIINTGIGWHEAQIPTIATKVPRAAFTWVTARFRKELSVPVITSNRINTPEVAEEVSSSLAMPTWCPWLAPSSQTRLCFKPKKIAPMKSIPVSAVIRPVSIMYLAVL